MRLVTMMLQTPIPKVCTKTPSVRFKLQKETLIPEERTNKQLDLSTNPDIK